VGLFDEYDTGRNPGVLKRLAEASGGELFFPKEIPAVTSILQEISRDIRNQYTIGYVASNSKRDGTYRAVRVKITAPHVDRWIVRTRMGYIAPKSKE
jgi:VWFA-related protein